MPIKIIHIVLRTEYLDIILITVSNNAKTQQIDIVTLPAPSLYVKPVISATRRGT